MNVLAMRAYSTYPGTTEAEARTVYDYVQFILDTRAVGQELIGAGGPDFAPLTLAPEALAKAEAGAEKISFI